jgi:DNA adenine methylase
MKESTPSVIGSGGIVRPIAPYIGGKKRLAREIVARIATIPHHTYAEPFIGMGGVFLRRETPANVEVINDKSQDVATLFRILQRHFQAFIDMLKWQLTSRAEFERLLAMEPASLTDLERAARFLYLQRTAFGGKVAGRNFGVSRDNAGRFDVTVLVPLLTDLHQRLAGVVIERLDWSDLLTRYDGPRTLFYLDPPYWGGERDYGEGMFAPEDFERLAHALAGLEGRFILSINDTPEIRKIFAKLPIEPIETQYTIGRADPIVAKELLISDQPYARKPSDQHSLF